MEKPLNRRTKSYVMAVALGLALSIPFALDAQTLRAAQQDGVAWHHQMRARAMNDMARIMGEMANRMSRAGLAAEERKGMAQRMTRMSEMMRLMGDWEANPAMGQAETKEPMIRMRREIDQMLREMNIAGPERKQGKWRGDDVKTRKGSWR
jgi:hypothetical protein